jgi:thioredoxin-like negative regulator of GroEL
MGGFPNTRAFLRLAHLGERRPFLIESAQEFSRRRKNKMGKVMVRCLRFVLATSVLSAWPQLANAQEVHWARDYDTARRDAARSGRPLVIDLGTTNCVYCKKLDAVTFTDQAVIKQLKDQFVAVKVDADADPRLVKALNIQSFPTLVFAAADGKILGIHEGFVDAARFRQQLQRALNDAGAVSAPPGPQPSPEKSPIAEQPAAASGQLTVRTTVPPLELGQDEAERVQQARRLLAQAAEDERSQQYVCCLERCQALVTKYADLPEAADAQRLATRIKSDPELSRRLCDSLSEQLGDLYLGLAEGCLRRQQPQQARSYLERLVQLCPGSRQALAAQQRMSQIQDGQIAGTEMQRKVRAQAP